MFAKVVEQDEEIKKFFMRKSKQRLKEACPDEKGITTYSER